MSRTAGTFAVIIRMTLEVRELNEVCSVLVIKPAHICMPSVTAVEFLYSSDTNVSELHILKAVCIGCSCSRLARSLSKYDRTILSVRSVIDLISFHFLPSSIRIYRHIQQAYHSSPSPCSRSSTRMGTYHKKHIHMFRSISSYLVTPQYKADEHERGHSSEHGSQTECNHGR